MSDLRELYQELILDHGRSPRNFGFPAEANCSAHGFNPLCGDKVIVKVRRQGDRIEAIGFEGSGCAISTASASTMTEAVKGKSVLEARSLLAAFQDLVLGRSDESARAKLGKLAVFGGVAEFPMRVKCATLAWHTLLAALEDKENVSTE